MRDSKKYTLKTNKSSNLKRKLQTMGWGLEPVDEESDASKLNCATTAYRAPVMRLDTLNF